LWKRQPDLSAAGKIIDGKETRIAEENWGQHHVHSYLRYMLIGILVLGGHPASTDPYVMMGKRWEYTVSSLSLNRC
jgi:hypothetical protein